MALELKKFPHEIEAHATAREVEEYAALMQVKAEEERARGRGLPPPPERD
jgi:hypothetical protein